MRRVRAPLSFGCGLLVIGRCLQMLLSLWYGVHAMSFCRVRMVCALFLCSLVCIEVEPEWPFEVLVGVRWGKYVCNFVMGLYDSELDVCG